MDEPTMQGPERRTRVVRFEGGPRDGTLSVVLELETGQPPEILLTPGRPDWVYVLAGGPRRDGSLPYMHMSPAKAALIRARVPRSIEGRTGAQG